MSVGVEQLNPPSVIRAYRGRFKKKNKFNAEKVKKGGKKFDSKVEYRYYSERLSGWLHLGKIRRLHTHPQYETLAPFTTVSGVRHGAVTFKPDYAFELERDGKWIPVVADVKGMKADSYFNLRRKLFQLKHPNVEFWVVYWRGGQWVTEVL